MGLSTQQWANLIVIALIVGFSALSWVARQLQEQAARKRALEEIERRREEMLRTGKDPATATAEARALSAQDARLREIAARRQAQLQELRRRAQMRQAPGGPVAVRTTPAPPPAPPRVAAPAPRPVAGAPPRRPATARPSARPAPPARPVPEPERRARPASDAGSGAPKVLRRPAAVVEGESHAERLVPDVPIEPIRPRRSAQPVAPRSAAEWRRAIVLREVLGPPVALRNW